MARFIFAGACVCTCGVVEVMKTLTYSEPGPASFLFPTMVLAFSEFFFATSLKESLDGVKVKVVAEVLSLIIVNSLKIYHSIMSGRPWSRSKMASSLEYVTPI